MVTINLSNKMNYTLLAIGIILLTTGIVYAVTGVSHTSDELTGVCSLDHPEYCPSSGLVAYRYPQGQNKTDNIWYTCATTCDTSQVLIRKSTDPIPTCKNFTSINYRDKSTDCAANGEVYCGVAYTSTVCGVYTNLNATLIASDIFGIPGP